MIGDHFISEDPARACYYVELDVLAEAEAFEGKEFAAYLAKTYDLDYLKIGHHLHSIMEEYKEEWLKAKK